jgi:outer membrane protein OmpA-like peptidoglycan-associated protein
VTYLVKNGIDKARLTAKGFGPAAPVADNSSKEGRAKNRRVEMKVLEL